MPRSISRRVWTILVGLAVVLTGRIPTSAASQDSFQPAGHLVYARNGSQATLLTNGKVLITGGFQQTITDGEAMPYAELFDPATGQSTALPSMADARDNSERAVLLKDGRVLIVSGGTSRLVEIFDPATNQFVLAGLTLLLHAGPTATLMPDGRVLIAGGWAAIGPTDPLRVEGKPVTVAAELFDPISGKSQPTGNLNAARYRHAAVTLPDGRVVLLGGYGIGVPAVSSVEIYDPSTGTFTPKGHLVESRANMTAHLLPDGRILVVGGMYLDANGDPTGARQSVEIYDPATGNSMITGSLPDARFWHTAAPLADGRILVAGGVDIDSAGHISGPVTAVTIDSTTGKVSLTAPLTIARNQPAAVSLPDGRVLIIGGRNQGNSLNTVEAYLPATAPGQTPR